MKELTIFEMEEISAGTDIFGNIGAAALGAVVGAVWGTLIGGTQSGANGGLLGFGLIGNAVGAIWGFIAGGLSGGVGGFSAGWDTTLEVVVQGYKNFFDGTFTPWSQ
ncbi:hypothetical protein [Klebsiella grimontii]|uniref:hypothetical protein n=1 Tax=Klebsiella grimontii TaxID=2058152 RepID=UPI000D7DF6CE|nr:hypothetical protein [Klebsiella grimontii]AWT17475.1 hypothetical protein DMP75_02265 [Klebsiella michiganensis]MBE8893628.1 hypothetical protein [Klebsiella grimontii]QLT90533.1 hypothetical protein HV252_25725 [Klebsiella grimontii]QQQ21862.1 hypothetical protein JIZ39_24220 [Klebsiella grimontii]